MSRLPVVSGLKVVKCLTGLGYSFVSQRGSHIKLRFRAPDDDHAIIVPNHKTVARGTLGDIISLASDHTGIPRDEILERLRNT